MDKGRTREARARARLREAAEWFVRHESGDVLPQSDLEEWHQWTADPENCAEFDGIVELRTEVPCLPRPDLPADEELHADMPDEPRPGPHFVLRYRFPLAVIAVAAVVVMIAALLVASRFSGSRADALNPGQAYTTGPGDQRKVRLSDGSIVTLAADTSLLVRVAARSRSVILKRGEALFQVEHDTSRPFTVYAGGGRITAVGTAFDVRRYSNRVHIAVTEGSVEVAPREVAGASVAVEDTFARETPQWIPVRLAHGQEMTYDEHGDASAPKPADSRVTTAWTQGALIYRGRPLREVVEDVQRYSARTIVLDPMAGDLYFTGTVHQRSIQQWLHRLPEIFPVEVADSESGRILIRAKLLPPAHGTATVKEWSEETGRHDE